jgi:hypothetical protein
LTVNVIISGEEPTHVFAFEPEESLEESFEAAEVEFTYTATDQLVGAIGVKGNVADKDITLTWDNGTKLKGELAQPGGTSEITGSGNWTENVSIHDIS